MRDQMWVSIDGVVTPAAQAKVSVLDRGFLFADSVYEVTCTVNGKPLFWAEHMARLWRSADYVQLGLPFGPEVLRADVDAVLSAANHRESYLRIVVTRGVGDLSMALRDFGPPTRVVYVAPLPRQDPTPKRDGVVLATFVAADAEVDPRAKLGDRRSAVLAGARARAAGAYEALRCDGDGQILEGATSTFFWVRDGAIETPPLAAGVLAGITRAKVIEVAQASGLDLVESRLGLAQLAEATEAFITSSTRGVVPVRQIDGHHMAAPGALTARVSAAYDGLLV